VVETQLKASTMRLVDSLAEQAQLETILEESKPGLPPGTEKLHYLLSTPFRYRAPIGSRFRKAFDPGIWYGGEELRTALAEKSYWRIRFLLDSPGTPDLKPTAHTAIRASVRARAVDLTEPPFVRDQAVWTHRTSYEATQAFGALARSAKLEAIRYQSVRDPEPGFCAAILTPAGFGRRQPGAQQTWFIAVSRTLARCAKDEDNGPTFEFSFEFSAAQLR
jgi:RES domain